MCVQGSGLLLALPQEDLAITLPMPLLEAVETLLVILGFLAHGLRHNLGFLAHGLRRNLVALCLPLLVCVPFAWILPCNHQYFRSPRLHVPRFHVTFECSEHSEKLGNGPLHV